jgi:hypothetical protein
MSDPTFTHPVTSVVQGMTHAKFWEAGSNSLAYVVTHAKFGEA